MITLHYPGVTNVRVFIREEAGEPRDQSQRGKMRPWRQNDGAMEKGSYKPRNEGGL